MRDDRISGWWGVVTIVLLVGWGWWGRGLFSAQAPPTKAVPNVEWQARRGYQPDVVLLKKTMPTEWQVCAERFDTDQVDCRPIDEVRKFLRERPARSAK